MESSPYLAFYAQLVGVGVLWVTVHCSGMCGPIMAGLVASGQKAGVKIGSGASASEAVKGVLSYQAGRGLMYCLLGMTAGFLGAGAEEWIRGVTKISGLAVAVVLFAVGIAKLPIVQNALAASRKNQRSASAIWVGRSIARLMRALPSKERFGGPLRMALSGFILGLLPCMLMFWVLGLSAATASPFHGAMLMIGLVVMTTPVLLAAGLSTSLVGGRFRRLGQLIVPFGMMFSGVWLGMIAIAANGWIEHIHLPFTIFGEKLVIMLW